MKKIQFDKTASLTQQCYEQIKSEIIGGYLKPSERLKITEFQKRFAVGQNPVREALSQLLSLGLVTFEENKGFRIAPVSIAEVHDIHEVFLLIETTALRLSLKRGDVEWEANLIAEYHRLISVEKSRESPFWPVWAEPAYLFHRALAAGCKSPVLLEIQRLIYLKTNRYAYLAYPENPEVASPRFSKSQKNDHKELVELALKRDIKNADRLLKKHVNDFFDDMIKRLKTKKLI